MKKFIPILKWLAIHIGAFLLAVWFFMGITPKEACQKVDRQLSGYMHSVRSLWGDFSDASVRLGKKVNKYGLEEANNVRQGKDYYEGYQLSK